MSNFYNIPEQSGVKLVGKEFLKSFVKKVYDYDSSQKNLYLHFKKEFNEFLEMHNNSKRIFYSEISSFIYFMLEEQGLGNYLSNLESLQKKLLESLTKIDEYINIVNNNSCHNINQLVRIKQRYVILIKFIDKIYDHSQLAFLQYTLIKQQNTKNNLDSKNELLRYSTQITTEIKNVIRRNNKFSKEANNKIKKFKDELSTIQNNNITVLGIFATIVATFFGFASFSATIFSSISQTETIKLLLLVSSTFLCFSLFLRLLVYLLCRLRSKSFNFPYYIEMFFIVVFFFALGCVLSDYSLPLRDKVDNVSNQSTTTIAKTSEPIKVNLFKRIGIKHMYTGRAKKFKNNFYFVLNQCVRRENKFPPPPPRQNFRKPRKTSKNLWGLVFNIRYVLIL